MTNALQDDGTHQTLVGKEGVSLGSFSSLGKGGGVSDLVLYLPAHVGHYAVNSLHQPRFNKDSSTLR